LETIRLLVGTLWLRPYVFVFLAAFLVVALAEIGPLRTLVWTLVGYTVAFLCEYSSTRNGFPFGLYHYHEAATRGRELWIANVPFMDSLSFVFLSFVSWATAERVLGRSPDPGGRIRSSVGSLVLGSLLMVAIDLICDPVSLRGDRWFLGDLYHYEQPGAFFGVPLSNFLGWGFVAAAILALLMTLERVGWLGGAPHYRLPAAMLAAPAFWAGIVLFNVGLAFWVGLAVLGWLGLAFVGAVGLALAFRLASGVAQPGLEQAS
jgi:putative membrane protein